MGSRDRINCGAGKLRHGEAGFMVCIHRQSFMWTFEGNQTIKFDVWAILVPFCWVNSV